MFLVQFYSIITCRDVSKFMKERNILGSSRGYLDRIIESYSAVTVTNVRKYTQNQQAVLVWRNWAHG